MDEEVSKQLAPGTRVKVTQQIPARNRTWTQEVIGTILAYDQRPTGSWFAHSKGDKLWLDRLLLKKEDGELLTLNLDDYSRVEVLSPPAGAPAATDAPASA